MFEKKKNIFLRKLFQDRLAACPSRLQNILCRRFYLKEIIHVDMKSTYTFLLKKKCEWTHTHTFESKNCPYSPRFYNMNQPLFLGEI